MKGLKALTMERTQVRKAFTQRCDEYDAILQKDEITETDVLTLHTKWLEISQKREILDSLDSKVKDLVLNEDQITEATEAQFAQEYDACEGYTQRFAAVSVSHQMIKHKYEEQEKDPGEPDNASSVSSSTIKKNVKYPKIEIKKFGGDLLEWISFWGQFQKIHEDPELLDSDKFQYLLQSIIPNSEAQEITDMYPPSKDNYHKVIAALKESFANEELLVEVYSRELLKLRDRARDGKMTLYEIYKKVLAYLNCLETLGVTTDKCAALLVPMVESVVHPDVLMTWNRYKQTNKLNFSGQEGQTKDNKLQAFMKFLKGEAVGQRNVKLVHDGWTQDGSDNQVTQSSSSPSVTTPPTAASLVTTSSPSTNPPRECIFCDTKKHTHHSVECGRATRMTYDERMNKVTESGVCKICLKKGHVQSKCNARLTCIICHKRHQTIICPEAKPPAPPADASQVDKTKNCLDMPEPHVLMETLIVNIVGPAGQRIPIRILLDTGSQRSYVVADRLVEAGIQPLGKHDLIHCLFGNLESDLVTHNIYDVRFENPVTKYICNIRVMDQKAICPPVARCQDLDLIKNLRSKGIYISDYGSGEPAIDGLFGADVIGSLKVGNLEYAGQGLYAEETLLGWHLSGKHGTHLTSKTATTLCLSNHLLADLWTLDMLGIWDPAEVTRKDQIHSETLAYFTKTVTVNADGRYEIFLPWLQSRPVLKSNVTSALAQLDSLTRKLKRQRLYDDYNQIFSDWEQEGIIEPASFNDASEYYLPHHAVIKDSSQTTRIRPVFNGSAKTVQGHSLNDCLDKGPNQIELIPDILIKFRLNRIGVTADIAKAFLQISINQDERNFLKFLWWTSDGQICVYRHCRVVFGLTCSPFLLSATLHHHLDRTHDPIAKAIANSFYVDNLADSVNNESELMAFVNSAQTVLQEGGFHLRCWTHSKNGVQIDLRDTKDDVCHLLGLKWNVESDVLFCKSPGRFSEDPTHPVTKRVLLSWTQRIFDPVGIMEPVVLIPKLLLQQTWERKLSWDEELPPDLKKAFYRWQNDLDRIENCHLRRYVGGPVESLHVFCDGSKEAYGTCVFARTTTETQVEVTLLTARSKVGPVLKPKQEKPTIPRMELLGALIAVRLASNVKKNLPPDVRLTFWTDSTIVLNWIQNPGPWSVFVSNRIEEIHKYSRIEDWRHVPGLQNPADLLSRGCHVSELNKWWNGPTWLRDDPDTWPQTDPGPIDDQCFLERRPMVHTHLVISREHTYSIIEKIFSRYSSYEKCVRVFARLQKLARHVKGKQPSPPDAALTAAEIQSAELRIFQAVQAKYNVADRVDMETVTEDGLIKVKTRLVLSSFPDSFIKPILLPPDLVTQRLIESEHRNNVHAGAAMLLCILRKTFWIINGKRMVRKVVTGCLACKKQKVQAAQGPPAPLPSNRVNLGPVFGVTGIDLAGPLFVLDGTKTWIVLYTCAVYRAIHLDLVPSLNAEAFIRSLKRMIARRGRIHVIYTDNGGNFVKTASQIEAVDWSQVSRDPALRRIDWHFNPPASPWWGGFWERMVRTVKDLLKRTLGTRILTSEELYTVLCETESVINQRPLTYVYDSAGEYLQPLTPAMFLHELPTSDTPDLDLVSTERLNDRASYLQSLTDAIKLRFQREYLADLVQRPRPARPLQVGDIVLISSDNKKRIQWPLGRIIALLPGADGSSRTARVKTATDEIVRPFQRLFPLEISNSEAASFPIAPRASNVDSNTPAPDLVTDKNCTSQKQVPDIVTTRVGRLVKKPKKLDL